VSNDPITTDDLLDEGEERTGLTRGQLVRMVGKSAAIRFVARHEEHGTKFVLKGGSLLTHVYGSPRQSIADADYVHLEPETVMTNDVEAAFTGSDGGFTMRGAFRVEAPHAFKGTATFSIEGIELRSRSRATREIDVTISIRQGEWLDPQPPVEYTDRLLAGDRTFQVQGLSVAELTAEKVLGWCSKDLAKHLVDIAYVERERAATLDYERVGYLVGEKFKLEKDSRRYRDLRIRSVSDLAPRFTSDSRLRTILHTDWERMARDELFFLPHEEQHLETETLLNPENIERLGLDFWRKLEPHLARPRQRR
jgi:predicted nucleotidyltransferase component of viral defense system